MLVPWSLVITVHLVYSI